jgi:HAMP domain-containing protein
MNEQERIRLRQEVSQVTNDDTADILMRSLPPTGWNDLATKKDLESLELATRADVEALRFSTEIMRAELKHDIADVRAELKHDIETQAQALRLDFSTQLNEFKVDVATEFGKVRTEMADMRSSLEKAMHAQTKYFVRMLFVVNAMFAGVLLAASRLF